MPTFKVFLKKVNVIEPVEIGEFEAKNEEKAIDGASFELGLHEQRYFNIENLMPELEAKLKKVV